MEMPQTAVGWQLSGAHFPGVCVELSWHHLVECLPLLCNGPSIEQPENGLLSRYTWSEYLFSKR